MLCPHHLEKLDQAKERNNVYTVLLICQLIRFGLFLKM